jgi:hypothetical protein
MDTLLTICSNSQALHGKALQALLWLKERLEDEQHPGHIYLLDSLTRAHSFTHDIAVASSPGWSPNSSEVWYITTPAVLKYNYLAEHPTISTC